jgi:hypothetical protein
LKPRSATGGRVILLHVPGADRPRRSVSSPWAHFVEQTLVVDQTGEWCGPAEKSVRLSSVVPLCKALRRGPTFVFPHGP